jgi:Putative Ig domain/Abnormal spindle-like microcephaly-assoc'd, ASPM-SPD-2-Hydin
METRQKKWSGQLFPLAWLLLVFNLTMVIAGTPAPAQVTPSPSPTPSLTPSPSPAAAGQPANQRGTAPPADSSINFSPNKLDFGDHDIGTTSYSQAVTLKNNGKVAIKLSVALVNDAEFAISHTWPESLEPGGECTISVRFTPIDAGNRQGKLTVNYTLADSSTPSSQASALVGGGIVPQLRLSQWSLDFGQTIVGSTSLVRTLILTAGKDPVQVPAIITTGDFAVTPVTCPPLGPSGSCSLSVTFTPRLIGKTKGSLTIINDKTAPKVISLDGEGLESCNVPFYSRAGVELLWPVVVLVLIYLLALVFVRWNMIARPSRALLLAEIGAVRTRVALVPTPPSAPEALQRIGELLDHADGLVTGRHANTWLDHLFWSRGQELAAWSYVHEAEEQLVFFLPEESVRAELERVEGDLREAATPTAIGLADRIHEALAAIPVLPSDDTTRSALESALSFLQPGVTNLAADVSSALKPDAVLTLEQWRGLATKVLSYLSPDADSLSEKIKQALASANPTVESLSTVLNEAGTFLESEALKLAATLRESFAAETANPTSPLKPEDWKAEIEKARDLLTPHASLIAKINLALAEKTTLPIERWRALHNEALGYLYDRSDTSFAQLVSWQNKTVWLVGCSLLLIVALAATLQHGILFLLGATGGLLSRLTRSLSREDVPTDYGASWSTLFLSPVVGALAGWSGILLVIVGVEFNILGSALKFNWCNTFNPVMLGIALLLGFSERFFDTVLGQLNNKLNEPGSVAPSPPPAPSITIVTAALLSRGTVDQSYSQSLSASGGTPPYKWELTAGALPAGLSLDPGGKISGMPTAKGPVKFTLKVSDDAARSQSLEFTIVIG